MRNLVFILFLGVFGFVVAGWFLDWYSVGSSRADNGQRRVQIDFDTKKIGADLSKGRDKLQDSWHWFSDEEETPPAPQTPPKPKE